MFFGVRILAFLCVRFLVCFSSLKYVITVPRSNVSQITAIFSFIFGIYCMLSILSTCCDYGVYYHFLAAALSLVRGFRTIGLHLYEFSSHDMVQCCCCSLTAFALTDISSLYLVLIFLIEINLHPGFHTMKPHIDCSLMLAVLHEQLYFCV